MYKNHIVRPRRRSADTGFFAAVTLTGDERHSVVRAFYSHHQLAPETCRFDVDLYNNVEPNDRFGLKTRSSVTAKSTARPSCLVSVLYDISREKICWWLINHFYVT